MNRFSAAALCLLLAGCGGENTASTEPNGTPAKGEKDVVFISGALLIPGDGTPPIEEATMIIENGVITKVGKKKEFFAPKGSLPLELEGKTLMPMMVNLNAYPGLGSLVDFGAKNYKRESLSADLNRYGYYGVDAVLAGGDSDGLAFQVRDELREGKTTGAMLYTSGRGIAAKGSSGVMGNIPILVSGDADARKAVGELADRNVDAIVLWADGMKADASNAVIDEAHKRKLKVFADAPGLAEAKNVVKAGVDALISSVRDRDVDDELVAMMKEKKTPLAPALTSLESRFVYAEDKVSWLGEQALKEVYPPGVSAYLRNDVVISKFRRNSQLPTYRQEYATATKNLKKLADAGVPIAFGSGSGLINTFPGYFEHRELELMVKAGVSPADAIKASSVSANALGMADLGVLAPGKKANLLVLSASPLEDITNTKNIDKVYVNGHDIDRQEMIRKIQMPVPKVTQEDVANERKIQEKEAILLAESKEKHYGNGKFVLGKSQMVGGNPLQTPRHANATVGPGNRLTVTMTDASAADLRAFYAETLGRSWTPAGDCWEKTDLQGKKLKLCAEASAGRIVLNITQ